MQTDDNKNTDLLGIFSAYDEEQYHDEGRAEFIGFCIDHKNELTPWERSFVTSNYDRKTFSPAQREIINKLAMKYPHFSL